jgi:ribose-phosphate pyrophosphokinase
MTALFAFPEQAALGASLLKTSSLEQGAWEWRHFPDGESYVRILSDVKSKPAIILCSLNRADEKIMPLVFLARTLKEFGCGKITLIAPYLGYMRQDKRFNGGEAVTSAIFAKLLSEYIDALVTIDPHLHRYKALEEIYACECKVLTAAPLMAEWIAGHVKKPLIIGPDMESEQWVQAVAGRTKAPFVILEKMRRGDREVEIVLPNIEKYQGTTPVLIDDIISTAATMIKTVELLRQQKFGRIVCLAAHSVFANNAYENLTKLGNVEVITVNTIPHSSNEIDTAVLMQSTIS